MNQLLHGVLNGDKLVYSVRYSSVKRQLFSVNIEHDTIGGILEAALQHNLHTVWLTPGDTRNYWTAAHAQDFSGQWDVRFTTTKNPLRGMPDLLKSVSAKRTTGSYEDKRMITICFPQWNQYDLDPVDLPETRDPIALLAAIHYVEQALGYPLHHNPGIAGRNLIAETNMSGSRPSWVAMPPALPPDQNMGFDFSYQRGIEQPILENMEGYVLYCWDKNSMYLGACSSVELGTGSAVYINPDELKQHYAVTMDKWYDGKRPGYWHIAIKRQPYPFNPLYKDQEWVTTPLLKALLTLGAQVDIREAFVWPEHHRVLDKYGTTLWHARQDIKLNHAMYFHPGGRAIASHMIKRIATAGIGMLANKDAAKYAPQWYRPDWQKTVIEDAKARLMYKLLQVWRTAAILPITVVTDEVIYVTKQPERLQPLFGDPDKLGGWKMTGTTPLTPSVANCFRLENSAGKAKRQLAKKLKEVGV